MVFGLTGLVSHILLALVSIGVVVFSAEKIVEKMQSVAKSFDISEVVVATTVISIGTSLPEISVHVVGSLNILDNPGSINQISSTVLGMNIGSDIVQQTLIMGSVVVLASVMKGHDNFNFTKRFLKRDYFPMIGAHILVLLMALNGTIGRVEGLLLLVLFASYIYYLYLKKDEKLLRHGDTEPSKHPWRDLSIALVGMVFLLYFSDVFLQIVELLISETGISGSMIGVATIGFVSAMPEFITAVSAVRKGAEGLSLGTLIGSNITNPLMGIGIGAAISSYTVPRPLLLWDLPFQIGTAVVLVTYLWNKQKIGGLMAHLFEMLGMDAIAEKLEESENGVLTVIGGIMLIVSYIGYIVLRMFYFQTDF
jgi:cation:H+ antiporter